MVSHRPCNAGVRVLCLLYGVLVRGRASARRPPPPLAWQGQAGQTEGWVLLGGRVREITGPHSAADTGTRAVCTGSGGAVCTASARGPRGRRVLRIQRCRRREGRRRGISNGALVARCCLEWVVCPFVWVACDRCRHARALGLRLAPLTPSSKTCSPRGTPASRVPTWAGTRARDSV
ncbi:hypothetical protein B0H12DRAFT_1162806 [Mycena haematopus]|nr:hypothetical protein B0H12DRAFT_1162806 [Mycena haematopus]